MKLKLSRTVGVAAVATLTVAATLLVAVPAASQGGRPLYAVLIGGTEVPGPGHPTATGVGQVLLNQGQGSVCYDVASEGLSNVVAGHIHKAPAGVAGPIVVHFKVNPDGSASDCAEAARDLIKDIRQNPDQYYVNLHTSSLPKGAIRGQLQKGHGD